MSEYLNHHETNNTETLATIEELKALAASQPRITIFDPRVEISAPEPARHTQYRDNFFNRFLEIRAVVTDTATEPQVTYTRMVKERFGLDLLGFYAEQPELCDAICTAIDAKEPYDRLVSGHAQIAALEAGGNLPEGSADELNIATAHPLGIEAIGMYYWDQINPLLERAYTLIDATTLNAPFLTK